ncbi:MAG: polymerase subunit epsilon [Campylobacterota bacterium]|nr:polymerase subunit epsilon [Campylobacterota bacterium]MDQ1268288.1 polymerase subunit epsilon [Campylobacterota bacterium]MDQ1337410.1 polymerase subunit epsilon [Campylobacterota bacterium]
MSNPHFLFTKYANSISVHVKNLEELSVAQIQSIEAFVSARKGIFDFNTYTFTIQKRLEFSEFLALIANSSIDAVCEEKSLNVQQRERVEFGKYKGMLYCDLPDSYLLWLKSNYMGKDRDVVEAELKFRFM